MKHLNKHISTVVTRYPLPILFASFLVSVAAIYFAFSNFSLKVVLEEMLPAARYNVQLYERFGKQFGGANTTLIAIEVQDGTIYDHAFLEKYAKVTDEVYFHPDAIRSLVQSLALRKTKAVSGSAGQVKIEAIMWPDIPNTAQDMETLRRNAKSQFEGFLVSGDEKAAVIIADFKDQTDYEKLLGFFGDLRGKYEDGNTRIYIAGRPALLGYIYAKIPEMLLIFALSILSIMAIVYLYFRSWIGVVVPALTATIATVWGFGIMGAWHYNLDPLLVLLPFFVFATKFSHSVQFTSRVLECLKPGTARELSMREAVQQGLESLLFPSTAAIVTDAAGFGVLYFIGIPSIKALALICTVWLLTITPSLLFSAAALCLMPKPKSFRIGFARLDWVWYDVLRIDKRRWAIVIGGLLVLGAALVGEQRLTIGDARGSPILWPDSRYNMDVDAINKRFTRLGTDQMQVYVEGDADTMLDSAVYQRMEALERHIYEHVPEVAGAQSLVPIIKRVNGVLYEGDPSYEIIPDSPAEIGFDIYLFRSRGEPGDFSAYTDNEWRTGNMSFFTSEHSGPLVDRLIGVARTFLDAQPALPHEAKFLAAGGQLGIVQSINEEIRYSSPIVLDSIMAVILTLVLLSYRSFFTAAILVFGLMTAHYTTFAFMAAKGIGLSINTLPLAAIGIGRGVDYGIYMIDRIREEYPHERDAFRAVSRAFLTSGSAIFVTAMTMIVPLIPWYLFSTMRFQAEMGLLLSIILFMNMLAALVLVPAAIMVFKPKSLLRLARGEPKGPSGGACAVVPVAADQRGGKKRYA